MRNLYGTMHEFFFEKQLDMCMIRDSDKGTGGMTHGMGSEKGNQHKGITRGRGK
jgi:hypothetical protein